MNADAKRLKLAAVIGLADFLKDAARNQPELAGLRDALRPVALEIARRGVGGEDVGRTLVDVEMAAQLVLRLVRDGLNAEACATLDSNGAQMLAAMTAAASKGRPRPGGAIQA